MTLEIGFLFLVLAVMVTLFLTEKLAVDLTAFLGLVVLIFTGYVMPAEAFDGFSSPAVITMMSVFILGAALLESGVADMVGGRIHRLAGNSEIRLVLTLMIVAGVLSAFMNNIAATAVLMPAVATLGPRAGLAPSRLFMPLAFGAILGGTTTLVGTPPNIVAAQVLVDRGLEPFHLFDFTPMGVAILGVGTLFMLTVGTRMLPSHDRGGAAGRGRQDLGQIYQLDERIFTLRLPKATGLEGRSLAETRLGNTLGAKVVAIQRGERRFKPEGHTPLKGGDVLVVDGELARVRELLAMEPLEVQKVPARQLPAVSPDVGGARVVVKADASLLGRTLREVAFRKRFGVVVVAIRVAGRLVRDHLAEHSLHAGDELFVLGRHEDLESFTAAGEFTVLETGLGAVSELQGQLCVVPVREGSELDGVTIAASRLGEIAGLTVGGILRGEQTRLAIEPDEVIRAGDQLLLAADPAAIEALAGIAGVELGSADPDAALENEETAMVEAAVAPRSAAEGRTLAELRFQEIHGLLALALWRGGRPVHTDLADVPLRFGDALLLYGPRERVRELAAGSDFLVLSQADQAARSSRKAPFALGGLLLMIVLVATGLQPIHVASFTAASLVILAGALSMKEAYRVIEWKAIFLVAAVLPVGFAMERSGAAGFLAESVSSTAGPLGPYAVLAALVALASLLSQGLDGAPSVVLMAPVVFEMADTLQISPYPLLMGVSLAASAAFMTPFSHKANLLVMGAGGYRSSDYVRVGTPLTLLVLAIIVAMVPFFFPF